ncbi:MAG: hypothetical protein DSM106950_23475 [Stigonema ocellatum SAG 48.90 = DSM 106950]|nr:hypothetical protein [Stigonema ocellatum SAG 48.90 = DSM 106950]
MSIIPLQQLQLKVDFLILRLLFSDRPMITPIAPISEIRSRWFDGDTVTETIPYIGTCALF